jgi:lysyl-tRNA synthetase class 2
LLWRSGPMTFYDDVGELPLAIELLSLATLIASASVLFRPLAAARVLPGSAQRRVAAGLVRSHGSDTLAFFKLRRDQHYLFSSDRRAFLGYRVENRVMLLAGDPVGPAESLPGLMREACAFAERHGLALGAIGVGAGLLPVYAQAGLRPLYLGDEAIVDARSFSLEGRAIRKVRQSVSRLEKAGFAANLEEVESLDERVLAELERVSEAWRQGHPERGFSMAMDSLRGEERRGEVVVAARDEAGVVRGFLHFVPSFGRRAMSLSAMRRDRGTPNGLMEFLVVRSIELMRERGVEEVSLNFAAFARLLHSPETRTERLLGRLLMLANPYFQIESLYRFNAKFFPRWEPRYLLYEGVLSFPRVGMAALWAEGQLPKPVPRRLAQAA